LEIHKVNDELWNDFSLCYNHYYTCWKWNLEHWIVRLRFWYQKFNEVFKNKWSVMLVLMITETFWKLVMNIWFQFGLIRECLNMKMMIQNECQNSISLLFWTVFVMKCFCDCLRELKTELSSMMVDTLFCLISQFLFSDLSSCFIELFPMKSFLTLGYYCLGQTTIQLRNR